MRPEGSLQLTASSWQRWLHPESHRTRGFNTEPRCCSPEGIIGLVLREIDPQHSYSQGYPASIHLQYTLKNSCAVYTHTPTHKHADRRACYFTHSSPANVAVLHSSIAMCTHYTHYTWSYSYCMVCIQFIFLPHYLLESCSLLWCGSVPEWYKVLE